MSVFKLEHANALDSFCDQRSLTVFKIVALAL